jgi:DNA/RNA-binding domain of Phe-tRNA-synthetase-like protein
MLVRIDNEVLKKYPDVEIGYLVARVSVKKEDPFVANLKQGLGKHLQDLGINATNFAIHPSISLWRKIYEDDFQVKAKTYRSSIEALLRRVVTGKEVWNICNVVDLYNCCSLYSLLPMGGYDIHKVKGDIAIRYAKEGETFLPLGDWQPIETKPHHIVYADDQRVICWLWNHKDSADTCIDEQSEYVIFFIDAFDHEKMQMAIKHLAQNLECIQGAAIESGILNRSCPEQTLKILARA